MSALVAEVDARLAALEGLEPGARAVAYAAVRGLAGLYGEGLARIVTGLERWDGARSPLALLLEDDLVEYLLILHELHPLDLDERVERALGEARPYLRSHGGDAEVVAIDDGVVRIRMVGSCRGCPSSAVTLRDAVEEAVRRHAPEIERVEEVGGITTLVQLELRGERRDA